MLFLSTATVANCTLSLQSWWWSSRGLSAWGRCSSAWALASSAPLQPLWGSPPEKFSLAPRGTLDIPWGSCTPRNLPPGFPTGCPSPQWRSRMWPSSGRRCPAEPSLTRICWSPATWTGSSQREVNLNHFPAKTSSAFLESDCCFAPLSSRFQRSVVETSNHGGSVPDSQVKTINPF